MWRLPRWGCNVERERTFGTNHVLFELNPCTTFVLLYPEKWFELLTVCSLDCNPSTWIILDYFFSHVRFCLLWASFRAICWALWSFFLLFASELVLSITFVGHFSKLDVLCIYHFICSFTFTSKNSFRASALTQPIIVSSVRPCLPPWHSLLNCEDTAVTTAVFSGCFWLYHVQSFLFVNLFFACGCWF